MKAYCAYHFTIEPVEKTDIFAAWLSVFPFESFVTSERGVTAYVSHDQVDRIDITACLAVPFDGVTATVTTETFEGQNWNADWEKQFHPIVVGNWTIRASFHAAAQTKHEIIIDPQMSFGTGHHATTQLMLDQLFELPLSGTTVLDMGTGTGVLAIAAKLKGATTVTGVDIESWCVENANENAVKNGITDIDFSTQTLEELSALQAAVIFANINRNVLMEHLSAYAKILTSDGILLLSGFHEEDAVILKDLAFQHGLKFDSRTEKDGWICLKFINS